MVATSARLPKSNILMQTVPRPANGQCFSNNSWVVSELGTLAFSQDKILQNASHNRSTVHCKNYAYSFFFVGFCYEYPDSKVHGLTRGGPPVADRTLVGPMLAPWTLLSRYVIPYNLRNHFHFTPQSQDINVFLAANYYTNHNLS